MKIRIFTFICIMFISGCASNPSGCPIMSDVLMPDNFGYTHHSGIVGTGVVDVDSIGLSWRIPQPSQVAKCAAKKNDQQKGKE